jgi:hypothetical protein
VCAILRRARRRRAPGRRARFGHRSDARPRPAGENFGALLASQQVGGDQLEAMLASLEDVFDPRRMHEGQAWRLLRTGTGQVRLFEYEIDGRSVLRITPNADSAGEFVAEVVPYNVRVTPSKSAATSTRRPRRSSRQCRRRVSSPI